MKNTLRRLGALLLVLALLIPGFALADYDYASIPTPHMIVVDADDPSRVYYERDADTRAFPASTTKIITCILAIENMDLDAQVTVGSEILGLFEREGGYTSNSSLMGLVEGETLTVRDLLYGLMLVSGNDAADALAVAMSGSIEAFVDRMNDKAQSLGMTGTHFVNPNGVQHKSHYTTARDMAKLAAYAVQNETFRTIVSTPGYTLQPTNKHETARTINNTNKLIYTPASDTESCLYPYAIGIKTGDTSSAGKCLVAGAEKDGARLICVLYKDNDEAAYSRFHKAAEIFEYLFDSEYTLLTKDHFQFETGFDAVIGGAAEGVLEDGQTLHVTVDTGDVQQFRVSNAQAQELLSRGIETDVKWTHSLQAPISQGTVLGSVTYRLGERTLYSVPLVCPVDVPEAAILAGENNGAVGSLLSDPAAEEPQSPSGRKAAARDSGAAGEDAKGAPVLKKVLLIALLAVLVLAVLFLVLVIAVRARKRALAKKRKKARLAKARAEAARNGTYRAPRR